MALQLNLRIKSCLVETSCIWSKLQRQRSGRVRDVSLAILAVMFELFHHHSYELLNPF